MAQNLSGGNAYQKRVYPELDGQEFMGPGPGRNEFTFFYGKEGDWFDASYYKNIIDIYAHTNGN